MDIESRILLDLLCSFMQERGPSPTEKETEWEKIYRLSFLHKVFPVTYDVICHSSLHEKVPEKLCVQWKRQSIAAVMSQMQRTSRFLKIYEKLREAGVHVLVVKGIICRQLYNKPDHRISCDEDLFVHRADVQHCHKIFLLEGLKPDRFPNLGEDDVISYYDPVSGLHIELHQKLFSETSKAYGCFNRMFEHAVENRITQNIEGIPILTMNHTDHMLFLICHSLKHFVHSGFGIRQICDMVMFANAYGKDIDWNYIMEKLKQIKGDVFWFNLAAIGEQYLGFSGERAGFDFNVFGTEANPRALLEDILEAGIYGKSTENRVHSSNMTLGAYANNSASKGGAVLLKTVFPSRRYLTKQYPLLERMPVLLPVIWLQRLIGYWKKLIPGKYKTISAAESLKIGNERIELMRKYSIITETVKM